MPTQTFFNLPEEKRSKLLHAAFDEFSAHAYEDASINAIIQAAEISRGSFYQYFADKDDLYFFLHSMARHKELAQLKLTAAENQGDIFKTLSAYYQFSYHKYGEASTRNFYQYFFRSSKYQIWHQSMPFHQTCRHHAHNWFEQEIVPIFDFTLLNLETIEEKTDFTRFAISLVQKVLAEAFIKEQGCEIGEQKLNQYFNWLKYGVQKQEE